MRSTSVTSTIFHTDDQKAYAANDQQLKKLLDIAKHSVTISRWNVDWRKVRRQLSLKVTKKNTVLNQDTTIKELNQEEIYKYLGISEGDGIQQ